MLEPIAVVGDVHGDARRLERMLTALRDRAGKVILVGDYVDRGPRSADVLEMLSTQVGADSRLVPLAGNHETELLHFIETGDFVRYAAAGGMATIRSYVGTARGNVHAQFASAFPARHASFLRGLATHYEDHTTLVSHCGFDPADPGSRTRDAMVDGRFAAIFGRSDLPLPRSMVVCGHYVQRTFVPFAKDGLYCVDTGCGTIEGPLTALLVPEREFVSV